MWDLVLKSLLEGTRGCNWILIRILSLGDMTFFNLKKYRICADVSNFGYMSTLWSAIWSKNTIELSLI